jgi:replicative DNA helicase
MSGDQYDGMPPHDLEAEQCALGSAMLAPDAAAAVVEGLRPDDFLRPVHKLVFAAVTILYSKGEPVNPVTVRAESENLVGEREHPLDPAYLIKLIQCVPTVGSVGFYVRRLQKVGSLRGLAEAGASIAALGHGSIVDDAEHAVEKAQKLLDEATRTAASESAKTLADLISPYMDLLETGGDQRGVTTGWADVDALLQRFRPGQLIVIGGRPGHGKSVSLIDLAYHVGVKLGQPVYVNTLEMATKDFMDRLVAYDAKVNLSRLIEPKLLDESDWGRLAGSIDRMAAVENLIIDDDPNISVARVRAALRDQRRAGRPVALACIDYLQLMQGSGRAESRQIEISEISRSLKLLAKEFEVPIVVGAQLNRNVEHRADKRPLKSDLRESGSLENDADVVILLHREDAYDKESPKAGEIDFIIDKNRQGPTGTVTLAFQGHYSRIVDMARSDWSPTGGMS